MEILALIRVIVLCTAAAAASALVIWKGLTASKHGPGKGWRNPIVWSAGLIGLGVLLILVAAIGKAVCHTPWDDNDRIAVYENASTDTPVGGAVPSSGTAEETTETGEAEETPETEETAITQETVFTEEGDLVSGADGEQIIDFSRVQQSIQRVDAVVSNAIVRVIPGDVLSIRRSQTGQHTFSANVQDNRLVFQLKTKGTDSILDGLLGLDMAEIEITLPASVESFSLESKAGDVEMRGFDGSDCHIRLYAGEIDLSRLSCDVVTVFSAAGEIRMKELQCQTIEASASMGEIFMEDIQAQSIDASASAGDINGQGVDVQSLSAAAQAGSIAFFCEGLEKTAQIQADLGEVTLHLPGEPVDYSMNVQTQLGSVLIDGKETGSVYKTSGGKKKLQVLCKMGEVHLDFQSNASSF